MTKKTKKARPDRETVPCRSCGKDTPMTGTKLCDNCWEVERRTGKTPSELDALQASHDIKAENLDVVRKERDDAVECANRYLRWYNEEVAERKKATAERDLWRERCGRLIDGMNPVQVPGLKVSATVEGDSK